MGYTEATLKLATDYKDAELRVLIKKELKIKEFSYQIKRKSLDARKKAFIHWNIQVLVSSEELKGDPPEIELPLDIPYKKRNKSVFIVGTGPAGFFAAFVLQKCGFSTTLIERGKEVKKRSEEIKQFEETGIFNPVSNYAFGEGGAGTFSDGKLTSRSKHIQKERAFIIDSYIKSGAPEEIKYLTHPHLGSDNLKVLVEKLREEYKKLGGEILFETFMEDLIIKDGKVVEAMTQNGPVKANTFLIAPGHSAYETYRMMIKRGAGFRTKSFAIGCRVEHPREVVNIAQWGKKNLPGVKAAEYRLTSKGDGKIPVYTFCMCPGGTIIPSGAYKDVNIVNGVSLYKRDGKFANAACVAGVNIDKLTGKTTKPLEALDWLENLEKDFYKYSNGFKAPFCKIRDFINKKDNSNVVESSYSLGLKPAPLWDLLPPEISSSIGEALKEFNNKVRGFDTGIIMGLDSKSSSPIQVLRNKNGLLEGFENLYMIGEGSGFSGGIISSAADGIKAAMDIISKD